MTLLVRLLTIGGLLFCFTGCKSDGILRITHISPKDGPYTGSDPVTIHGSGFQKGATRGVKVYFEVDGKSKSASVLRFDGSTRIIVDPPGGQIGEVADLLVIFEDGRSLSLPKAYTYTDPSAGYGIDEMVGKQ